MKKVVSHRKYTRSKTSMHRPSETSMQYDKKQAEEVKAQHSMKEPLDGYKMDNSVKSNETGSKSVDKALVVNSSYGS